MKRILQIDMHPTVGTQLNYSVKSWKWGKEMIELKLDNGNLVQINPSYVIAIVCEEVEEEGIDFEAQWDGSGCAYCGGNCPHEPDDSEFLCDGFSGDIEDIYVEENPNNVSRETPKNP